MEGVSEALNSCVNTQVGGHARGAESGAGLPIGVALVVRSMPWATGGPAYVLRGGVLFRPWLLPGGAVLVSDSRRVSVCPSCGGPKSLPAMRCARCAGSGRGAWMGLQSAMDGTESVENWRRGQTQVRLYCFSCSRSTVVASVPLRPGRCATCGGTMSTELETS